MGDTGARARAVKGFAGATTVLLLLAASPDTVRAQVGSGGAEPAIPGSAVVHVSPVSADTLPLLCHDSERPEAGFVTEMNDPEWAPRLSLSLSRPATAPDQAEVTLELDGARYTASFPAGESGEGYYTALATVTGDGGSRMISFTASCLERLARG